MYYTIYQITNNVNGKIYIGAHQTKTLDDDYMGSGYLIRYAHKKYGLSAFSKEILFLLDSKQEMFEKERELVTEEFVSLKTNYNISVGGKGGFSDLHQPKGSPIGVEKQKWLWENDVDWSNKRREQMSKILQHSYETGNRQSTTKPHMVGEYTHSLESKQKISDNRKGKLVGKDNPKSKQIQDDAGLIFDSIKECALYHTIHTDTVSKRIKRGLYKVI